MKFSVTTIAASAVALLLLAATSPVYAAPIGSSASKVHAGSSGFELAGHKHGHKKWKKKHRKHHHHHRHHHHKKHKH